MHIDDHHDNEYGGEEEPEEDGVVIRPNGVASNAARDEAQSDGGVGSGKAYCRGGDEIWSLIVGGVGSLVGNFGRREGHDGTDLENRTYSSRFEV